VQIYYSWQGIKEKYHNLVVGLGNFDGVHLGHQKLIEKLVKEAKRIKGTSAVFTFYPHPDVVLNPSDYHPLLLTQETKRNLIARLGVNLFIQIPFNTEFARITALDFVKKILYRELGVHTIFIGYNYTFGYKGEGTAELLKESGSMYGFTVQVISPVIVNRQVVSSTYIRNLLLQGKVTEARDFLGYYPFVEGMVVSGEQRGNLLGFPTANLEPETELLIPARGVYAVKIKVEEGTYWGVANIGVKPTFHPQKNKINLEAHILDYYGNLYHRWIKVIFLKRLREEKKFSSPEELITQIKHDIYQVRSSSLYNNNNNNNIDNIIYQ
jgi:riboflavin kinase/FMN adenylyltransferase